VVAALVRQSRRLKKETEAMGKAIFREKPRKFADKLGKRWTVWRVAAVSKDCMG